MIAQIKMRSRIATTEEFLQRQRIPSEEARLFNGAIVAPFQGSSHFSRIATEECLGRLSLRAHEPKTIGLRNIFWVSAVVLPAVLTKIAKHQLSESRILNYFRKRSNRIERYATSDLNPILRMSIVGMHFTKNVIMIPEMLSRGWEDFLARFDGPLHFRFIFQPTVASIIAIIAGLNDAKAGRPPFLWTVFFNSCHRRMLVNAGWKDIGKVFFVAVILDVVYQLVIQHSIYPGELLVTAGVLALAPYVVLRGPVNRLARMCFLKNRNAASASASQVESKESSQS